MHGSACLALGPILPREGGGRLQLFRQRRLADSMVEVSVEVGVEVGVGPRGVWRGAPGSHLLVAILGLAAAMLVIGSLVPKLAHRRIHRYERISCPQGELSPAEWDAGPQARQLVQRRRGLRICGLRICGLRICGLRIGLRLWL